jgi:hypothetical protein
VVNNQSHVTMTINDAAAFTPKLGPYQFVPLATVAGREKGKTYLARCASGELAECRAGTEFHTAATIVVRQLITNSPDDTEALADILAGRWIDAGDWQRAVAELSALNEASRDKRQDAPKEAPKPKRPKATSKTQTQSPVPAGGLFAAERPTKEG